MDKINNKIEEKDKINYYFKDTLKHFIINRDQETTDIEKSKEVENMIYAFSLFIDKSDAAYNYNLSFLPHNYEKFTSFLDHAKQKYDLLKDVVGEIKESKKINNYLQSNKNESNKLYISINDFLISDLNNKIDLYDNFSINGANRRPNEDIFTIVYKSTTTLVRAKKVSLKKEKNEKTNEIIEKIDCTPLIKLVEKILGLTNEVHEGENIDG